MKLDEVKNLIRDIPDFPKPGIMFKDITPILQDPDACETIVSCFCSRLPNNKIDCVAGIESRGFLFGPMIANQLKVPFVPIRKKGKLPYKVFSEKYDLEYGKAEIEVHQDAITSRMNVLIHDDLLATGGTVNAAINLVKKLNAKPFALAFVIELSFLNAAKKFNLKNVVSLLKY